MLWGGENSAARTREERQATLLDLLSGGNFVNLACLGKCGEMEAFSSLSTS